MKHTLAKRSIATSTLIAALLSLSVFMWVIFVMLEDNLPETSRSDILAAMVGFPLMVAVMVILDLLMRFIWELILKLRNAIPTERKQHVNEYTAEVVITDGRVIL